MILGFHFILSAYGFWLPNDPRGSWSEVVREFNLLQFGPATKVSTTRSLAAKPHDYQRRQAAKRALRYSPITFTREQAVLIARGFGVAVGEGGYVVHAMAILTDHVHLVMAWHVRDADLIGRHLKSKATYELSQDNRHPMQRFESDKGRVPSPWSRNQWIPYIYTKEHMRAAIRYVEQNPVKAGLKRQKWNLVVPYVG